MLQIKELGSVCHLFKMRADTVVYSLNFPVIKFKKIGDPFFSDSDTVISFLQFLTMPGTTSCGTYYQASDNLKPLNEQAADSI